MYGLATVTAFIEAFVKKWISTPGICCLAQRIAGVVKTMSPIDEKRMNNKRIVINNLIFRYL
jgi:hypothetical protein